MEIAVYAAEAEREQDHWWFVGRRRLFAAEMARAGVSRDAAVLDVGTGTGSNLRMLRDLGYTRVTGLDQSDEAIRFCASKGLGGVSKGVNLQFQEKAEAPRWQRSVFNGLAQIIVQSTKQPGEIKLTARSPGLAPAVLAIPTKACTPRPALP